MIEYIKPFLNSTVGTQNVKPLDEIIKSSGGVRSWRIQAELSGGDGTSVRVKIDVPKEIQEKNTYVFVGKATTFNIFTGSDGKALTDVCLGYEIEAPSEYDENQVAIRTINYYEYHAAHQPTQEKFANLGKPFGVETNLNVTAGLFGVLLEIPKKEE